MSNEQDEGYAVMVTEGPIEDTGTIVVFRGVTDEDEEILFGVDHRLAQDLVEQLEGDGFESHADEEEEVIVICHVENWQILSRRPYDPEASEAAALGGEAVLWPDNGNTALVTGSDIWVEDTQLVTPEVTPVTEMSIGTRAAGEAWIDLSKEEDIERDDERGEVLP